MDNRYFAIVVLSVGGRAFSRLSPSLRTGLGQTDRSLHLGGNDSACTTVLHSYLALTWETAVHERVKAVVLYLAESS
jgi:hypothetical protein